MDKDLVEKCLLTDRNVRTGCVIDVTAGHTEIAITPLYLFRLAKEYGFFNDQLEHAIPIIQKAERERLVEILEGRTYVDDYGDSYIYVTDELWQALEEASC